MKYWKKNLAYVWLSQLLSIAGFAVSLPFVAFFLQRDLGVTDPDEVKMWNSVFYAAAPLALAIFSPFWGYLADRFGRKPMLLRAYIGAGIVLSLMGMVTNPYMLIALRFCQGMFTGTVTASQALIASSTPDHRSGFALGFLSSAVYSGFMVGSFVGGYVADIFGYRVAFYLAGVMFLFCALLVMFGVREDFDSEDGSRDQDTVSAKGESPKFNISVAFPVLLFFLLIAFCRMFDAPIFPLLVQEIHGSLQGAARETGTIYAVCGISGMTAGICSGWLSDRFSPEKVGCWMCVGAGLLMIPQGLAGSLLMLMICRFVMVLFTGGLEPIIQAWLAKITPSENRGIIFGWASTARSLGWIAAPVLSGYLAVRFDLRVIFFIGAFLYMLLTPVILLVGKRIHPLHLRG